MEESEDVYASCIEDEFEPSHMVNMVTFGGNNESRYSSSKEGGIGLDIDSQRQ